MTKKKDMNYYRNIFVLKPLVNDIYGSREHTIDEILSKKNFYGIDVESHQVGEYLFITTRSHFKEYALQDRNLLKGYLESFGLLVEIVFQMRQKLVWLDISKPEDE